jgi:hypothetical protein
MLTTHPLLVPRLRNSRSYTSCHTNAPLWSVTGPLYLYLTHSIIVETEETLEPRRRSRCFPRSSSTSPSRAACGFRVPSTPFSALPWPIVLLRLVAALKSVLDFDQQQRAEHCIFAWIGFWCDLEGETCLAHFVGSCVLGSVFGSSVPPAARIFLLMAFTDLPAMPVLRLYSKGQFILCVLLMLLKAYWGFYCSCVYRRLVTFLSRVDLELRPYV